MTERSPGDILADVPTETPHPFAHLQAGWYRIKVNPSEGDIQQIEAYFTSDEIQFTASMFKALSASVSDMYSVDYEIFAQEKKQVIMTEYVPVLTFESK